MFKFKTLLSIAAVLGGIAGAGTTALAPQTALANEPTTKAVVIMYHRFGETDYPSTNVTMEQFRAHVEELRTGGYNVASLPEIVAALRNGEALPPKTVGLSVDDAYVSVYERAWPILKEAGYPLSVFVATDPVERGLPRYMNWEQLRELADQGVTIGSQTKAHPHMAELSRDRVLDELRNSNALFEEKLGRKPDLFAYPYGETNNEVMALVKSEGFVAAFGQHSGAIGSGSEMYYLPRFAMNESFGSVDRFRLAANALPIRVADITPDDPTITGQNPPAFGFTLNWPQRGLDRLNCYASHADDLELQRLGKRIEVRTQTALPRGRTRLNCTMPAGNGRWYWFGRQFYVPK